MIGAIGTQVNNVAEVFRIALSSEVALVARGAFLALERSWSYAGKFLLLQRQLLNIVIRSCRFIPIDCASDHQRIKSTITTLKMFNIFSVVIGVSNIPAAVEKIWQNRRLADYEGLALSSISATVLAADTLDSFNIFVNATLQTFAYTTIQWMSTIELPLGFVVMAGGSFIRLIHVQRLKQVEREVEALQRNPQLVDGFVQTRLNTPSERAKLLRWTSKSLFEKFERLQDNPPARLREIHAFIKAEKANERLFLIANAATMIALSLFYLAALSPVTPFVFLAIGTGLRLKQVIRPVVPEIP